MSTPHFVVYGDFNCPYCCLASFRADALSAQRGVHVEWRAVEHDRAIPTPSEPVDDELAEMLDREVAEVRGLVRPGEQFPINRPWVQPNTGAAVAAFASTPPDRADEVRRAIFAALWFDDRDIGDREVLADLGAGSTTTAGAAVVTTWRDAWLGLDRPLVPMLVLPDGYVSRGLGALARLADLTTKETQ
jgi:predicted DsbA family dithiol-disulfide isomerase